MTTPAGRSTPPPGTNPDEAALTEAAEKVFEAMDESPGPAPTAAEQNRIRQVLTTMATRVTAERAVRAAESAAEASRRAAEAAAERATDASGERQRQLQPFRVGFFGALGVLIAYTLYLSLDTIRGTLILIAVAALLAIGLDPAVTFFQRRGVKRGWSVTIVFLTLMAALGGVIFTIVPPVVTQLSKLVESAPNLISDLQANPTIKSLDEKFGLIEKLQNSSLIQDIGTGAVSVTFTVAGVAVDLLIALILTLYFLGGLPKIKATAYRLAPATRRARVTDLGNKIIGQLGGYLSGATIIAVQAGLVAGVFSWIVGLPYPWAIALAAAVLDFVPVIGPITVGVSMMLLGFTQSVTIGLIAAGFYICQHLFEAYWLYPKVMRRTVDISAGAVVVAIVIGAALLGVTGALLAVPVAAAIQLIVREVVMPMQERN